jgi:4-amino-4-deoxy-L-arabinose transferase-like glycosyltransferase
MTLPLSRKTIRHSPFAIRQLPFAILLILLLAFAARLHTLDDAPIWYDEGLVGWAARLSLLESARWTASDVHPPLYFWLATVWRGFVGEQPFALRFISVVAGILSVVFVYKIGARIHSELVGIMAALLVALSRFSIWWSQELRMYSLGSALTLLVVWCALTVLHERASRKLWFTYIVAAASGLLTLYLFLVAIGIVSLYALGLFIFRKIDRRRFAQWCAAQGIVGLIALPWFLFALTQYRSWSVTRPFDFALFMQLFGTLLAVGVSLNVDDVLWQVVLLWGVIVGAITLWLIAFRRHRIMDKSFTLHVSHFSLPVSRLPYPVIGGWLIALILILPPLGVYLASLPRSFFYTPRIEARYLLPFAWSFYLILAWSIWRIAHAQKWLGLALAGVVVALSAASSGQYYEGRHPQDYYQSIASLLRAYRQPNDAVLLHSDRNWPMFAYAYAGAWNGVANGAKVREADANDILKNLWAQSDGVWLVVNEDALRIDPQHALEHWLSARSVFTHTETLGLRHLSFYARTAERARRVGARRAEAQPAYALSQRLSETLTLQGYDLPLRRFRVGDEAQAILYWENRGDVTEVTVALRAAYSAKDGPHVSKIPAGDSLSLLRFPVTADWLEGRYELVVEQGAKSVSVAVVEIVKPTVTTRAQQTDISTLREARFQNGMKLVGYDAPTTTLRAGETLPLTLYWQTDQPITQKYKVFTHILGRTFNAQSNNFLWGQQDQEPLNGALPTSAWPLGQLIADPYTIPILKDAPTGKYIVEIGFYHVTTGERLMVVTGDGSLVDHINLLDVEVR